MSDGMFDSLSDAGMRPPKAMTPPNSAMEAAREIRRGLHLATGEVIDEHTLAEIIARHQSKEREELLGALQDVKNYFWGTESPVLKEGEVQTTVESLLSRYRAG